MRVMVHFDVLMIFFSSLKKDLYHHHFEIIIPDSLLIVCVVCPFLESANSVKF